MDSSILEATENDDYIHIEAVVKRLGAGINGNVVVLGMCVYDIRGKESSMNKEELAELIMRPNGINIFF